MSTEGCGEVSVSVCVLCVRESVEWMYGIKCICRE